MTLEQVAKMRDFNNTITDDGKRLAGALLVYFDDEVRFNDAMDYVIYDDSNELLHTIRANVENPVDQARLPYRITTGMYEHIQYMEALYDMSSFKEAVQGLLVDSGLINEAQKEHIFKWAVGIQNHTTIPKAPGPYFKDTILPIGHPPVPEIRDDGLHHGAPAITTYQNKIHGVMRPAIEESSLNPVKRIKDVYDIELETADGFGEAIKTIIESFPTDDLYMASFTDNRNAAIYNPAYQDTVDSFVDKAQDLLPEKAGQAKRLLLYVEAYNTRVCYTLVTELKEEEAEDPNEFINNTKSIVNNFLDSFQSDSGTIKRTGTYVDATISTTNIGDDVDQFMDLIIQINPSKVIYKVGSTSITLDNIGDTTSIENFKKGVIDSMPTENNETVTGTVEAQSAGGASVVYTLKVKYLNVSEAVAKIGDKYYSVLANAIASAVSGDTIELLKNVEIDNAAVSATPNKAVITLPAGVSFNGGGFTITAADGWTINPEASYGTNHLMGISSGTGTISNVTLVGNANVKSGIVAYGNGTNVTVDTVTVQNCGNCGLQDSGATVTLTNWNTSGNAWGSVNADNGSDGSVPTVTFVSGTMAEPVEIYTEITDQDVVTAASLTKYQGFGTNLKGFIYYTSDVSKLGTVYNGAVYETINDMVENNDVVELTVSAPVTEDVTVPTGKTLNLTLAEGVTVTNATAGDTITNNGTMTIAGTGVIDNTTDGKAPINNNGTLTILGGTITRSLDDGQPDVAGTNSYYTIVNHGTMVIGEVDGDDSAILVKNTGGYSALVENGWYDSAGKDADDICTITINSGTFQGGKYCLKNDELGVATINGGIYSDAADVTFLNWHELTVNDATATAVATKPNFSNGTYGQGVGKLVITGGDFTAQNVPNISMVNGYASSDVTVTGGTFSSQTGLSNYVPEGYEIDSEINPGKYTVVKTSTADAVEEQIDSFIEGLNGEGVTVEAEPDVDNTYTIITDGSLDAGTMIDQIVAIEEVDGITISDGDTTATYVAGGDLAAFKSQVNAMLPTLNEDAEVILTMTVDVAE